MRDVRGSGAVVFACLCICWAAGSVFLALIYEDVGRVAVDFLQCKPPEIVIFPWGGFLSSWEGVIYDAADQVTKPPALRQKAWRASNVGAVLKYSGATQSLGGHYHFGLY